MDREFVLVRLYRLGDLAMASALVRAWKAEEPTQVTWIVAEDCAAFLHGQPYVNRLIVIPLDYIAEYKQRTVWREEKRRLIGKQRRRQIVRPRRRRTT